MTKITDFEKRRECKHADPSPKSSSAWYDIHSEGDILKLHYMCPNSKSKCQKEITLLLDNINRWEMVLKVKGQKS